MPMPHVGAVVGQSHHSHHHADAGRHASHLHSDSGRHVSQGHHRKERHTNISSGHGHRSSDQTEASEFHPEISHSATSSYLRGLSPGQRLARRFIRNHVFETVMGFLILSNFVMIIIEANATAEQPDGTSSDAPLWIEVCGWVALGVFVIELILRLYVEGTDFFHDSWNDFDFLVITIDTTCSLLGLVFGNSIPVSALRILRLAKLARVTKIFRVFPELRLMMAGLIGCMRSIFWGMVLLIFILLVWAVIGVQFIHPLNSDLAQSGFYQRIQCDRCPKAYANVQQASLTLLRESVAGDGWGSMTVPLIEEYPGTALYFIGVMMSISMALLNLILGVVVNVAMQARDDLAAEMEAEKVMQRVGFSDHLERICMEMDSDGSGQLSRDELFVGYRENEAFRTTLTELGIAEEDLEILWTILDPDGHGQVELSMFIRKSFSMKESDTQFMLAHIKFYVTKIRDQVIETQQQVKEYMLGKIEDTQGQIEERLTRRLTRFTQCEVVEASPHPETEKQHVASEGLRVAADVSSPKVSDTRSPLSADDMNVLDGILEKLRQWREELGTSIEGAHARIDSIGQDAVRTKTPQPISGWPGMKKKKIWCCNDAASQSVMESIVGRSEQSAENVVHVSGERLLTWRSSNSSTRRLQPLEMVEGRKSSSVFGQLMQPAGNV